MPQPKLTPSSLGALFTHLAPTAIALPSYFCFADLVLITQCAYYNHRNARKAKKAARTTSEASEDSPLLAGRRSSSAAQHNSVQPNDADGKPIAEEVENNGTGSVWAQNALSLVAVYAVGIAAFFISYKAGAWNTTDPDPGSPADVNDPLEWVGLTLGYVSALFYLCARVPQIYKNYKDKSCEGW